MKLYLVERDDCGGYDSYDSFVCWARSADEARYTSPDEYHEWRDPGHPNPKGWYFKYHDGTYRPDTHDSWVEDPSTLKVWELSRQPLENTVVLSSFNAG